MGRTVRSSGPRCFTLIELLVVVAILSMLMGMLLPSLRRAREASREVYCLANQRSVGTAVLIYAGEQRGRLPSSESWVDDILPNIDGEPPNDPLSCDRSNMPVVLFCPCDDDPYPKPYMNGRMEVTSFFVNGAATDFAMGGGRTIGLGLFGSKFRLENLGAAPACMMLGETTNYGKVVDLDHPAAVAAFAEVGANVNDARTRFHHRATSGFYHCGKMSVHFIDGHGAALEGREVAPLDPMLWPGGALMNDAATFFPNLSLPTATEKPGFWGPPYSDWEEPDHAK